jgi:hypothetical protein
MTLKIEGSLPKSCSSSQHVIYALADSDTIRCVTSEAQHVEAERVGHPGYLRVREKFACSEILSEIG